jgi:hypothetical protein
MRWPWNFIFAAPVAEEALELLRRRIAEAGDADSSSSGGDQRDIFFAKDWGPFRMGKTR